MFLGHPVKYISIYKYFPIFNLFNFFCPTKLHTKKRHVEGFPYVNNSKTMHIINSDITPKCIDSGYKYDQLLNICFFKVITSSQCILPPPGPLPRVYPPSGATSSVYYPPAPPSPLPSSLEASPSVSGGTCGTGMDLNSINSQKYPVF